MKKLLTILGIIASVFTVILSILPISNLAVIPGIIALALAGFAYYLSKKSGEVKKIIPFTLMLTGLALILTTYKAMFTETVVEDTKVLEETEIKLEEEAIEELEELDIEELEIDEAEIEAIDIEESNLEIEAEDLKNIDINENVDAQELEIIEFEDVEIDETELENLEIE
ncbi:FUSC family protein [Tamlana sp. 62-3]|uniref:FUSC family protein n=1 Tax=Neotamlana sargassicola TaxID=2883125 RepID=A0A9X1L733_9FLAO|nr:FUSC family protein [Tamlana sargassicola]MCB4808416.1 FUSC family protein [Tamlana sargassicola]